MAGRGDVAANIKCIHLGRNEAGLGAGMRVVLLVTHAARAASQSTVTGDDRCQPVSGMKVGIIMPVAGVKAPRTWAKCNSQLRAPQP